MGRRSMKQVIDNRPKVIGRRRMAKGFDLLHIGIWNKNYTVKVSVACRVRLMHQNDSDDSIMACR